MTPAAEEMDISQKEEMVSFLAKAHKKSATLFSSLPFHSSESSEIASLSVEKQLHSTGTFSLVDIWFCTVLA